MSVLLLSKILIYSFVLIFIIIIFFPFLLVFGRSRRHEKGETYQYRSRCDADKTSNATRNSLNDIFFSQKV